MSALADMADVIGEAKEAKSDPHDLFELTEKLGQGSYGSVFKGLHRESMEPVAIKTVPIDGDFEDLAKEIRILRKCKSDYIVRYYGSYSAPDSELWIVMEYCGAGAVSDLMEITEQLLTEPVARVICAASLLGLDYLHQNKNIHRDIKAGNILLTESGQAKLADFGVSAQMASTMSKQATVIGTPYWMAPEIIQEIKYNGLADIWSLGITLIEMLQGEPPMADVHPMRAIFMIPTKPAPRMAHPERWSPELNDFVAKCLVKNPNDRASAADLLSHPFVASDIEMLRANQGKSPVLAQLVADSMDAIQAYREQESEDDEDDDDDDDDDGDDENARRGAAASGPSSGLDSGTMVYTGGAADSGTMIYTGGADSGTMVYTGPADSGTMVYTGPADSGTMVYTGPADSGTMVRVGGDAPGAGYDTGTMVYTGAADSGTMVRLPAADGAAAGGKGREVEPSEGDPAYLKYWRARESEAQALQKISDADERASFIREMIANEDERFAELRRSHEQFVQKLQQELKTLA